MGLIHPSSLERWQDWERSRQQLRRAKHAVTDAVRNLRKEVEAPEQEQFRLHSRAGEGPGRILFAVDSASPTSRACLLTALPYLRGGVDVLAPAELDLPELQGEEWEHSAPFCDLGRLAERGITVASSLGWHLAAGRAGHEWAAGAGVPSTIVQHGALTPYAPPLPPEVTLFAWTAADGDFQCSGRQDVDVRVIGSQLLWQASREAGEEPVVADERPVFLGQMHGAELPRRITARTAYDFCRRENALYRPHPSEKDLLSRNTHKLMKRRGVEFQDTAIPLRAVNNPVVSIFSTGVMEAAVRGIPAWVTAHRPPTWVREFWDRYGMAQWGSSTPTVGPDVPADEPARLLAQHLEGVA